MDRRNFLISLLASGGLAGTGLLSNSVYAGPFAQPHPRRLVSILLSGGPDMRHLMPPLYSDQPGTFAYEYWRSMASSHNSEPDSAQLKARFNNEYDVIENGDQSFGLLKSCGWLKSMWEQGHVAVVNNVLGSSSRNHPLSVLASEIGDRSLSSATTLAPGVGGRLAALNDSNLISLTPSPRGYCYGPSVTAGSARSNNWLVSARDTRALALFDGDDSLPPGDRENEITRNLTGYYSAKSQVGGPANPAHLFLTHSNRLRELGIQIEERLSQVPEPAALARLYNPELMPLFSQPFGLQVRNLYDSLACADILDMSVASMEYKGFDSHRLQVETLEPRFNDLFGSQQGLDTLYAELPDSVTDQLVFVLAGEFGRQIRSNGDGGTDHGEGGTVLIIGRPVVGGVYGNPYPDSELELRDHPSPQIAGLTAIERIHALLADWHTPGAAHQLFPNLAQTPIESGVNLSALLPSL